MGWESVKYKNTEKRKKSGLIMNRQARIDLIHEIEEERGSKVLVYITGDRAGLQTKIGVDTFPFLAEHLEEFNEPERIDLFLYSTGGVTMAGYSLVNLIRENCQSFGVLIPFKALSCATLVTLGADDIVMTKTGQLSPIDPLITHPLGPSISVGPGGPRQVLPVSVEDIFNYVNLAKEELGITDVDSLERVLENLSQKVHPLILGMGYRLREQSEFLARTLLSTHMDDENKISNIIEKLTRGRFSHNYIFNRKEVKEILKLPIIDSASVESKVSSLFREYQQILQLANPHSRELAIGDSEEARRSFNRAIIESENRTHVFRSEKLFRRIEFPIGNTNVMTSQVIEQNIHDGWVEDNTI